MPTYVYRREDGSTFEIEQSIKDDALTTCPTTGQKVTRIIAGGTGLIFKGSGFYLTDYARKQSSPPSGDSSGSDSSGGETSKTQKESASGSSSSGSTKSTDS